jgi:heme/copper-type cytochrome/quinol oxidase subunit 4
VAMSKQTPIGLTVAEKFFGLLAIIVGALLVYFTYTSPPTTDGQVANYSFIFIIAGFVLVAFGIFLLLARSESD